MHYQVDINDEFKKAKSRYLRYSLLFSLILTIVIVGDVLLILLSKEDYLIYLIIASIVTILFIWFAIYFFTVIYSDINNRYRYFKGYESGLKPVEEVEFIKKSDELCYVNGLYVYPLFVTYKEGINEQNKIIYALNKDVNYEMGDKLTITTYQRILLEAEKHA